MGSFPLASGVTYDVRFSLALSSVRLPQAEMNVYSNAPAFVYQNYSQPGGITVPTTIGFMVTAATSVTLSVQFVHVRVRF